MSILSQTSINATEFCPNINNTNFKNRNFGANLQGLADLVTIHYVELNDDITENTAEIHDLLDTVENVTVVVQGYFDQAENVIWLVPGLLLAVSIVTALATFGVILAWKQDSGIGLQRCMSYGVLPILVALCVTCVILACAASASTAVSAGEFSVGTGVLRGYCWADNILPCG
jgi:CHASE2 domain-containing sensor protein